MKIGNVELSSNIILAPMAGYTDLAFRKMCLEFGAGLVCTEMVSSKALHFKNKKTEDLLLTLDEENPKAVQIFGSDPEVMAEAVANPLLDRFDIIDINMGCPARKIVSNGDGSALLKNMSLAKEIISSCVKATNKPITVKFRIGYEDKNIVAVEFAKMCEEAGASAITVHGRTTMQGYSGTVNYEVIRQVKQAVSIPVFANGDCRSKEDADRILKLTGADGIMVGRACLGKPELMAELISGKEVFSNKLEQITWHYKTLLKFYEEKHVVKYMRSHLSFYMSGKYKNSKALVELIRLETVSEVLQKLEELFNKFNKI